jgi:hypothetical protein
MAQMMPQNRQEFAEADAQVIENVVELVGIEPTTSSLRILTSAKDAAIQKNRE